MELKTCLQFDETVSPTTDFNPELCLFLPETDSLFYAEGSFLLSSDDKEEPLEFPSQICFFKSLTIGKDSFLVLVFNDGRGLAITFKVLAQFIDIFPFKIVKIDQNPNSKQVFLLTSAPSLLKIDNFVLFTRLTPDLLKERFESGQVIKEFHFSSQNDDLVIKDFIVLEDENQFLTVGINQMISWWKFTEPSNNGGNQQSASSILNLFFTKPQDKSQNNIPKLYLTLTRFLNEPDRCIDKILTSSGNLALLEDSTHGRLLLLDTEHALIIKTFKGYRNCSAACFDKKSLRIWSGNRFSLEEWCDFPFGDTRRSLIDDASDSLGSFDAAGYFFLYSQKLNQLQLFI